MHLLITAANDATSDLICERLEGSILRLNWERWNEYSLDITPNGFRLADRFGRGVSESTLKNVIWRKPVSSVDPDPGEFWYCFEEFKYAVQAVIERVREQNPRKLPIDPNHNATIDKFKQLRVASRHLSVPQWTFTCQPSEHRLRGNGWIVKSVTGKPIPGKSESKVIYTSSADPSDLSDGFPWLLQEKIEAAYDLTIVYVDGELFPFVLDRKLFNGLDWRRSIGEEAVDTGWVKVQLPPTLSDSLIKTMRDLRLRFGRIDMLTNNIASGDFWFLEINPNGQWAWLDMKQDNGLVAAVIKFLTSE